MPTHPPSSSARRSTPGSPSSTPRTPTARASARSAWPPRCAASATEVTIGTKFGYDITVPHDSSEPLRAPAALGARLHPRAVRGVAPPARDRPDRPLRAAQPADERDRRRRDLRRARRTEGRRQDPSRTASRSARRSAGRTKASTRSSNRNIDVVQTVFNVLEQEPGTSFLDACRRRAARASSRACRTHPTRSWGRTHADTVFPATDHRSFRKREWLLRALQEGRPARLPARRPHDRAGRDRVAAREPAASRPCCRRRRPSIRCGSSPARRRSRSLRKSSNGYRSCTVATSICRRRRRTSRSS